MEDPEENIVGKKFETFQVLKAFIEDYQKRTQQIFTVKNSEKFRHDDEQFGTLCYKKIEYKCKFGGGGRTETTGQRQSSTFQQRCPAFIKVAYTKKKDQLEIKKADLSHSNHPTSKAFFQTIPENRRLSPRTQKETIKYLEMGCNKKKLQSKLMKENNKIVTLKDLSNLKTKVKSINEDDLSTAVKLLETEYGATVKILQEDNQFKGLFFATQDMRNNMSGWPDIVLIDGTYKLINSGLTVMLLIIEDSNALSGVVGVGLLATEDRTTFEWFLTSFKDMNSEACSRMQCMMGDKDLLERDVLKEVFPGIPIYICRFHTLRTFSRVITAANMGISTDDREKSLKALQKLVYSTSESDYDKLYLDFCNTVPKSVRTYFDKNWHNIRTDWTTYSMVCGNLGNLTNNRLESMNGKIKQVIQKNSSLVVFIRDFFIWLRSHDTEVDVKTAYVFLKKPVEFLEPDSDEKKFKEALMPPSFKKVLSQIKLHRNVTNITCLNRTTKKCSIDSNNAKLRVTASSCQCAIWTSDCVPCRHIFAVRKYFNLPLFAPELCQPRCTKSYVVKNQRSFRSLQPEPDTAQSHPSPMLRTVTPRNPVTVSEKRKKTSPITSEMLHLASLACGTRFERRFALMKEICNSWRQGCEVEITTKLNGVQQNSSALIDQNGNETSSPKSSGPDMDIERNNNLSELFDSHCSISEEPCVEPQEVKSSDLTKIQMPTKIKTIGRPSGFLATTNRAVRRKDRNVAFSDKDIRAQIRDILSWLLESELIEIVMKGESLIRQENFNVDDLRDSLVDETVDINIVKEYFEPHAFASLMEALDAKKERDDLACATCKKPAKEACVICDRCLLWQHYECVGLVREPKAKKWFCPPCSRQ